MVRIGSHLTAILEMFNLSCKLPMQLIALRSLRKHMTLLLASTFASAFRFHYHRCQNAQSAAHFLDRSNLLGCLLPFHPPNLSILPIECTVLSILQFVLVFVGIITCLIMLTLL